MNSNINLNLVGTVMIHDDQGNLVVKKQNAIHPQNMALVVARALAREDNGYVFELAFGNGGTFYNTSSSLVYKSPNVMGSGASLYNETYSVQVDDLTSGTPTSNSVSALPSPAPALTSLVVVTAQLAASTPPLSTGASAALAVLVLGLLLLGVALTRWGKPWQIISPPTPKGPSLSMKLG